MLGGGARGLLPRLCLGGGRRPVLLQLHAFRNVDAPNFRRCTKRVIGHGISIDTFFTGAITAVTPEEINFDLMLPFDKIRIGSFTLNRKERWMTSLGFPGRTDLKDRCFLGPPAPVLDLWPLLRLRWPEAAK